MRALLRRWAVGSVALLLAVGGLLAAPIAHATVNFRDTPPGTQFYDEIMWLSAEGISTGWPDGTFRPVQPVNRDAMAAFLYRLAGSPSFQAPKVSPFKDVPVGMAFYKEMSWLAAKGISTGWPDGTFRPVQPVNRDAMAAFLYRFADSPSFQAPKVSPFKDVPVGTQFYTEMSWMAQTGASTGWPDGTFRPLSPVNRDAMAAFMYRLTHVVVTTESLPEAYLQQPYSARVTARLGVAPYTWSASMLPAGLSIDPGTGIISGTPTMEDPNLTIDVAVRGKLGQPTVVSLPLPVTLAPLVVTAPKLPVGTVGVPYSSPPILVKGGVPPYGFEAQLPRGLWMDPFTGAISGTPMEVGDFQLDIHAHESHEGPAAAVISRVPLVIHPPATVVAFSTPSLATAIVGEVYDASLTASGGVAPYTFSRVVGELPRGLTFSQYGGLTGRPQVPGTHELTFMVEDAIGMQATKKYSLVVRPPVLSILTTALPDALAGATYSVNLDSVGGYVGSYGAVGWTATGLPAGLQVQNRTGHTLSGHLIRGVPTEFGTFSVTVTAADAANQSVTKTLTLQVRSEGAVAVSAGSGHTCALTDAGSIRCWGSNSYGELGAGTTTFATQPQQVLGVGAGASEVATGESHTCAVIRGAALCWGRNDKGQLGDGTTLNRAEPGVVTGLGSGVVGIATGFEHACALLATGSVKCWGGNSSGGLGDGTKSARLLPVEVVGLSRPTVGVFAGGYGTCVVNDAGGAACWGSYSGATATPPHASSQPVPVAGLATAVTDIAMGHSHRCALLTSGAMKCWGYQGSGELGNGTLDASYTPLDVTGLASGVASITAGLYSTCAVLSGGTAKCWGWNGRGQLGDGTTSDAWIPRDVVGLGARALALSAGSYHTCGVDVDGAVSCWGEGTDLGNGPGMTSGSAPVPVRVVGLYGR